MNDNTLKFSDSQQIRTTGDVYSTNVLKIDGEKAYGEPVDTLFQVVEDFNNCTSVEVTIETAVDEAFTTPVALISSGAIPLASLTTGYKFNPLVLPKGNLGYMRAKYTVAGTAPTTGAIFAGIVDGIENSYHNA